MSFSNTANNNNNNNNNSTPIFKLVHAGGDSSQDRIFDPSQTITIGRDITKVSIPLPANDSSFSRVHCKLFTIGRDVRVQDTSSNGTFVNGKRLSRNLTRVLSSGDKLSMFFIPRDEQQNEKYSWIFYSSLDGGITIHGKRKENDKKGSLSTAAADADEDIIKVYPNEMDRIENVKKMHKIMMMTASEIHGENPDDEQQAREQNLNELETKEMEQRDEYRQQELDRCPPGGKLTTEMRHARMGDAHSFGTDALRLIYEKIDGDCSASSSSSSASFSANAHQHHHQHESVNKQQQQQQEKQQQHLSATYKSSSLWDHYVLLDRVGSGAFASVFRGYRRRDHVPVAIKVIEKSRFLKAGSSAAHCLNYTRMKEEGNMLREINHPNIIKVYDVFDEEEIFSMVMEFIYAGDLFDLVSRRANYFKSINNRLSRLIFSEEELKFLFLQLYKALAHLQIKNIIHRDIKLENILVQIPDQYFCELVSKYPDDLFKLAANIDVNRITLKLSDFGCAKFYEEGEKHSAFVGTKRYFAPEMAAAETFNDLKRELRAAEKKCQALLARGANLSAEEQQQQIALSQSLMRGQAAMTRFTSANRLLQNAVDRYGYTCAVDVFSLGVVLHLMVFGDFPITVPTSLKIEVAAENYEPDPDSAAGIKVVRKIQTKHVIRQDAKLPESFHLHVSNDLRNLIQHMLRHEPNSRITIPKIGEHVWLKGTDASQIAREHRQLVSTAMDVSATCPVGINHSHNSNNHNNNNFLDNGSSSSIAMNSHQNNFMMSMMNNNNNYYNSSLFASQYMNNNSPSQQQQTMMMRMMVNSSQPNYSLSQQQQQLSNNIISVSSSFSPTKHVRNGSRSNNNNNNGDQHVSADGGVEMLGSKSSTVNSSSSCDLGSSNLDDLFDSQDFIGFDEETKKAKQTEILLSQLIESTETNENLRAALVEVMNTSSKEAASFASLMMTKNNHDDDDDNDDDMFLDWSHEGGDDQQDKKRDQDVEVSSHGQNSNNGQSDVDGCYLVRQGTLLMPKNNNNNNHNTMNRTSPSSSFSNFTTHHARKDSVGYFDILQDDDDEHEEKNNQGKINHAKNQNNDDDSDGTDNDESDDDVGVFVIVPSSSSSVMKNVINDDDQQQKNHLDQKEDTETAKRLDSPKKKHRSDDDDVDNNNDENNRKNDNNIGFKIPNSEDAELILSPRHHSSALVQSTTMTTTSSQSSKQLTTVISSSQQISLSPSNQDAALPTNGSSLLPPLLLSSSSSSSSPTSHQQISSSSSSSPKNQQQIHHHQVFVESSDNAPSWYWKADLDKNDDDMSAYRPYTEAECARLNHFLSEGRKKASTEQHGAYMVSLEADERTGYYFQYRRDDSNLQRTVRRAVTKAEKAKFESKIVMKRPRK